jgi:nucleotide-binding universal stress UspA family protein
MPTLSRILVPVEFSPRCRGAVEYAEALACHFHSEIVLLHVVTPPLANVSPFGAVSYTSELDLNQTIVDQRTALLEAFPCAAPADAGVRRVVLEGDPARVIVEYASSEHCDMIVMPTHGHGPFRRFLLGSVTGKVLHDAVCPVLTGPHMERAPDYSNVQFRNVVCAIDLGPHSRQIICWAATFAREFGARLSIVHAIPLSATRLGVFYFDPEWRVGLTRSAVERIAFLREDMKIEAAVAVEAGEPPVVVSTAAAAMHADLLVVGRGSTPTAHGHLPTNAYAIAREAPCPVITI